MALRTCRAEAVRCSALTSSPAGLHHNDSAMSYSDSVLRGSADAMKASVGLLAVLLFVAAAVSAKSANDNSFDRPHDEKAVPAIEKTLHGARGKLVLAQFQPNLPPPPPQVPLQITPTLQSPLSEAARATNDATEVITRFRSAAGSDPTTWYVPAKAVPPPEMLPAAVPAMRAYDERDVIRLRREIDRLKGLLFADGITVSIQGLSCALGAPANTPLPALQQPGPENNSPGEGTTQEIGSLIVSIADVQRRLDEVTGNVDAAGRYRSCLRAVGVTPPPASPPVPIHTEPLDNGYSAPRPVYVPPPTPVTDRRPCEPQVEEYSDYVLMPTLIGFDSEGQARYNQQWQTIRRTRMKGC